MIEDESSNAIVKNNSAEAIPVPVRFGGSAVIEKRMETLYMNDRLDALLMQKAEMMSRSAMVPAWMRGDMWACYNVQQLAYVFQSNPTMLATKMYKVSQNANVSFEAQLIQSILERFAPIRDGLIECEYIGAWDGILGRVEKKQCATPDKDGKPRFYSAPGWNKADEEGLGIRIFAIHSISGKVLEITLMMSQCVTRNSTLWAENPKMQIWYRGVATWGRRFFPGIIMGMYTKDEMEDSSEPITVQAVEVNPAETKTKTEKLKGKLKIDQKADPASVSGATGNSEPEKTPKAEPVPEEKGEPVKNSDFISGFLAESKAPVSLDDVKTYLKEFHKLSDIDSPNVPDVWNQYIRKNVATIVSKTGDWNASGREAAK